MEMRVVKRKYSRLREDGRGEGGTAVVLPSSSPRKVWLLLSFRGDLLDQKSKSPAGYAISFQNYPRELAMNGKTSIKKKRIFVI